MNFSTKFFTVFLICFLPIICFSQTQKNDSIKKVKKGQFIVLPNVAYSPETSLGLGFALFYNNKWGVDKQATNKTSSHSFYGLYTLKKQMNIGFNTDNWFSNNNNHIYVSLDYNDYPFLFYPVGGNAPDIPESYSSKFLDGQFLFERQVFENLYVGAQLESRSEKITKVEEGKLLAKGDIIGSNDFNVFGIAPTVTYDSRDNVMYPTKGVFHLLKIRHFNKALSNQNSFTLYDLDLRKYMKLNSMNHILAVNLRVLSSDAQAIPFQMLPNVGGDKVQRGYFDGRFKDSNSIVARSDYRFPISNRFKIVAFGSVSMVNSSLGKIFSAKPHPAGGIGVRYRLGNDGMHIRIDFAYGNQFSPYVNVNESF